MVRKAMVLITAFAAASSSIAAQATSLHSLEGRRIRLKAVRFFWLYDTDLDAYDWAEGTLAGVASDSITLLLEDGGDTLTVPIQEIAQLQVFEGRRSGFLRGLGYGFLSGAAIGVLWAIFEGNDPEGTFLGMNVGAKMLYYGGGLGLIGTLVGGVAGAVSKYDSWDGVDLEVSSGLSGGPMVSIQFSF